MLGGVAMVLVIMLRNRLEWDEIDRDRWNERANSVFLECGFVQVRESQCSMDSDILIYLMMS